MITIKDKKQLQKIESKIKYISYKIKKLYQSMERLSCCNNVNKNKNKKQKIPINKIFKRYFRY